MWKEYMTTSRNRFGIFVGRMNPIHNGHINIINEMIRYFGDTKCMVLLGSCNNETSLLNIYTYSQRLQMFYMANPSVYKFISTIGIPDFPNNNLTWFNHIKKLVELKTGDINHDLVFYGGSHQDVFYAIDAGYETKIISRFEGEKISSSEIKDRLIKGEDISDLVPENCIEFITSQFKTFWETRYSRK